MQDADDMELLRRYCEAKSDDAFAALVTRYVNLVYSTALRQVGNPHAAEEVTQAVFLILAQKASRLRQGIVLSSWLYQTARFASANYLRTEIRRARREQEAYMQSLSNEPEPDLWPQIAPLFDTAMGKLSESDRSAIVLRFFENRNLREVGEALGTSEDAAKMRVNRALEKLRKFFLKRGVAATGALIASAISANTVHAAPAGLVISAAAASAQGTVAAASTLTLAKGAMKLMAWAQLKPAAAIVGTAALLATSTTVVMVGTANSSRAADKSDIAGLWQGTGEIPERHIRARGVFNFTKVHGTYRVTLDVPERGIRGAPMQVEFKNRAVRAEASVPPNLVSYEGTLNADGTEISGFWKEQIIGAAAPNVIIPVTLRRASAADALPEPLAENDYAPRRDSDLQGSWRGVYQNGNLTMPLVMKFAEGTNGIFRGEYDSPCEGMKSIPVSVEFTSHRLKLGINGFGAAYAGTMDAAHSTITGTISQGGGPAGPLIFKRIDPALEAKREQSRNYQFSNPNELQGQWKSTVTLSQNGQSVKLNLTVRVARFPDGTYSASLDNPAQFQTGVEATRVMYSPPQVRIDWRGVGYWFEGKLKDGELTGRWHAHGAGADLEFERLKPEGI